MGRVVGWRHNSFIQNQSFSIVSPCPMWWDHNSSSLKENILCLGYWVQLCWFSAFHFPQYCIAKLWGEGTVTSGCIALPSNTLCSMETLWHSRKANFIVYILLYSFPIMALNQKCRKWWCCRHALSSRWRLLCYLASRVRPKIDSNE